MSTADSIIDNNLNESNSNDVILHSRKSIFLLTLLASPFMGFVLYAFNLIKVQKKESIIGLLIYFTWSYIFAVFPFFGFEEIGSFLIYSIGKIILGFLLIGPLWKLNFNTETFTEKFSLRIFLMLTVLYYTYSLAPLIIQHFERKGFEPAFYIPSIGGYFVFILLLILVFLYFIYLVINTIIKKLSVNS